MKGKVKWFNDEKGYGFINAEDGKEIFVHFSSIIAEGHRTLNEGDDVNFEIAESEKGLQAKDVQKL